MENTALTETSGSQALRDNLYLQNQRCKVKKYVFVAMMILGSLSFVVVGSLGLAAYFKAGVVSNLTQIQAISMMAAGGVGFCLMIIGMIGFARNAYRMEQLAFIERTHTPEIHRFGKAELQQCLNITIDEEQTSLPQNIDAIMNGPCPFSDDPNVKVGDTHTLLWVPAGMTFNRLLELSNPQFSLEFSQPVDNTPAGRSYWVLVTRDVIPGSRNRLYPQQQNLVRGYPGYQVTSKIEAGLCILAERRHFNSSLFGDVYTRCRESETENEPFPINVGIHARGLSWHTSEYLVMAQRFPEWERQPHEGVVAVRILE